MVDVPKTADTTLKAAAWRYGCAPTGSEQERKLRTQLLEVAGLGMQAKDVELICDALEGLACEHEERAKHYDGYLGADNSCGEERRTEADRCRTLAARLRKEGAR